MPNPKGPARHAASNNYTFAYVRCEVRPAGLITQRTLSETDYTPYCLKITLFYCGNVILLKLSLCQLRPAPDNLIQCLLFGL